jgi:cell division protein FtsW
VLLAVGGAVTMLAVAEPYRLKRLLTFVHPFQEHRGAGYQTVEGLYALASGGVFGVGLGNGTSKYEWVPNANTDYVFSVIGEELGLLGCVAVLALFALFAYTGMRITRRNADPFVRLAAGGATVWICGQAVINVGYVTALLPVTGIPLPFISAGGTSLLATFLVFGMLVSFARHEPAAVAAAQRAAASGTRSRIERWLRVPVPKAYAAPKRRSKPKPKPKPAPRPKPRPAPAKRTQAATRAQPAKRAQPQPGAPVRRLPAAPRSTGTAYRSTGTQRRRA